MSDEATTTARADESEIERLIAEIRACDASMSPAPWRFDPEIPEILSEPTLETYVEQTAAARSCADPILDDLDTPIVLLPPLDDRDAATPRGAADSAGVVMLRNSAPAIADQLAAALREIRISRWVLAAPGARPARLSEWADRLAAFVRRWSSGRGDSPEVLGATESHSRVVDLADAIESGLASRSSGAPLGDAVYRRLRDYCLSDDGWRLDEATEGDVRSLLDESKI